MGVFSKPSGPEHQLKRNTFPESRQINTTFPIGALIPFSVREALAGERVSIRPSVGFRLMPTYFPIQNRIKAYINYFYVRNRNLYSDFKQWLEDNNPKTPPPYLGFTAANNANRREMFSIGGLADYMHFPVTRHVSADTSFLDDFSGEVNNGNPSTFYMAYVPNGFSSIRDFINSSPSSSDFPLLMTPFDNGSDDTHVIHSNAPMGYFYGIKISPSVYKTLQKDLSGSVILENVLDTVAPDVQSLLSYFDFYPALCSFAVPSGAVSLPQFYLQSISSSPAVYDSSAGVFDNPALSLPYFSDSDLGLDRETFSSFLYLGFMLVSKDLSGADVRFNTLQHLDEDFLNLRYGSDGQVSVAPLMQSNSSNPFNSRANPNTFQPISTLPFRAYEQIYNSFYRDDRNNPLLDSNGQPVYDEFLLNTSGGVDDFEYKIHYRNWEQDMFTTALQTPQQGAAPLVGISETGVATFLDTATGDTYTATSETSEDADTIVNMHFTQESVNKGIPSSVARSLVNAATSGISINDFRNVNALQRWKELNLRRGRKYRDLMQARYGVNISYAEMNMPEFIGGATFDVVPVQVNQTSSGDDDSPLGSYAGQLYCEGRANHTINHFCDEPGFIIGIVSVVPVPVYETVTPKFYFKNNVLDYWSPEFNHIGLQPVPKKELDVFGSLTAGGAVSQETFGYQRPWYEYISSLDVVSGQLRTSLSGFLMFRQWTETPSLTPDFLTVSNLDGIEDVFSVRTDSDGNPIHHIVGQIYEDYVSRNGVSRYGIARLE